MIGDLDRYLWFWIGCIHFSERSLSIHIGTFNLDRSRKLVCFFQFLCFLIHQIIVITGEHFHGVKSSWRKVLDGLRKSVGRFLAPFHPEKRVADMFGIGRAAQAHKAPLDPAISWKLLGFYSPILGRM